jgi:hypothetical protein
MLDTAPKRKGIAPFLVSKTLNFLNIVPLWEYDNDRELLSASYVC